MSVLASGSTGNATYVESDKGSILVDAGLTGKKMEEKMVVGSQAIEVAKQQ